MDDQSKEIINRLKNIQYLIKNKKKNSFEGDNRELLNRIVLILEKILQHLKKR